MKREHCIISTLNVSPLLSTGGNVTKPFSPHSPKHDVSEDPANKGGANTDKGTDVISPSIHYNIASSTKLSMRERRETLTFSLLRFNNWVKNWLIQREMHYLTTVLKIRGVRVLDLGSGVGGDMWKYKNAAAAAITFVDTSTRSIEEIKRRNTFKDIKIDTLLCDMSDVRLSKLLPFNHYDMVVSMFSLHYIFSNKMRVMTMFRMIYDTLPRGGHFLGIVSNGDAVHEKCINSSINKSGFKHISRDNIWSFIPKRERTHSKPSLFGESYKFSLKNAVYSCDEYFTCYEAIRDCASCVGLKVVNWEPILSEYERYVSETSHKSDFCHLTTDLLKLEDCYYYFSLEK